MNREKKTARENDLDTCFIQGDARNTGLAPESFGFVLVMGSSFGYFTDEDEDKKFLKEGFRLLKPNGAFLLDLPDRDYVLENFKAFSTHKASEDIEVTRERDLREDVICTREKVFSKKNGLSN